MGRKLSLAILTLALTLQLGQAFCTDTFYVPKLAFLFLARGGMPLEKLWDQWFRSVKELVPTRAVKEQLCDSPDASNMHTRECSFKPKGDSVLDQQLLFSVYVHSSRQQFADFAPDSVFHGTLVADQGQAAWGDTSPAVRILLRESLKDHRNHKFVLLSDSDIPLYPAKFTYSQLIQERISRVDACTAFEMVNVERYTCDMVEDGLDIHKWRKSALWMSMTRKHAELFRDEQALYQSFQEKCSGVIDDEALQTYRGCLTDEHYYGSVLAVENLAHETDCVGAITMANFEESFEGHPKMYDGADTNDPELLKRLRERIWWFPDSDCANETHLALADQAFSKLPHLGSDLNCASITEMLEMPAIESWCHLFYRKFAVSAVDGLTKLMKSEKYSVLL